MGSNSSGKSTFLRSFPLFAQSVKKNLRGPISWFDDSMVDFGSYETAINFGASKDEGIAFSYILKAPFTTYDFYGYRSTKSWYFEKILSSFFKDIKCKVSFANDKNGTYVNSVNLSTDSDVCTYFIVKTHKVFCEFSQFTKKY